MVILTASLAPISAKWFLQVLRLVARWEAEPFWGDCDIGVMALDMGFEIDSDGEWIAIEYTHQCPHSPAPEEPPSDDFDLSELIFVDEFGNPLVAELDLDLSAEVMAPFHESGGSPGQGYVDDWHSDVW